MNNRNLKGNSNAGRKGKVVITGAGAGVGRQSHFLGEPSQTPRNLCWLADLQSNSD
jgi:hypothetical protein